MGKLIDGKAVSAEMLEGMKAQVQTLRERGIEPCLAVIIVGDNPASRVYVNNKAKACAKIGILSREYALSGDTTERELLELVETLNADSAVSGILCQLPLPPHINESKIIESISPAKDVDAFHPQTVGKMFVGSGTLLSCTPAGILELLRHEKIEVAGKHCVVIGRSNIVGKPVALLLLAANATVTICHSKTENLAGIVRTADIIVAAVGRPHFVTADMVKEGATVIDVGINRMADGKLCGDVDFETVAPKAAFITPVPGGVGPMTIAMLMKNTLEAARMQAEK